MNSFTSLLNVLDRLEKQDKLRSKQISYENCQKRMIAPVSFLSDFIRMATLLLIIFILHSIIW